jgi:CRP-like cAMP-binding protein
MICTVCSEEIPDTRRIMCSSCASSYRRNKIAENTMWSVIEWSANRARKAEHRRLAHKIAVLEEKLRIEIATTDGLIRKYGKTTTEIGDMNAK